MTFTAPARMSDRELLVETRRVVDADRRTTAELLALLAEIDARKLYRDEGHSSLFTYCTHVLRLSEPAAYSRITAARAAKDFPTILTRLANGDEGRCAFVGAEGRCPETGLVEFHHVVPFAAGGETSIDNLQLGAARTMHTRQICSSETERPALCPARTECSNGVVVNESAPIGRFWK